MGQKSLQNSLIALSLALILLGGQIQKKDTDLQTQNEVLLFINKIRENTFNILCQLFHKKGFVNEVSSDIKELLRKYELNGVELNDYEINEITNGIIQDLDNNGVIAKIFRKTHEGERIFFALLYSIIFLSISEKILKRISENHETASNVILTTASGINGISYLSNGPIDSMGIAYLATSITGLILVYINKTEKGKIKDGLVIPNQQNAREIGLMLYEQLMGDNNPYTIYDLNADTLDRHIQIWNPAMEKLTGYKFEEIKLKTQNEIFQLLYGHEEEELKKRNELTDMTVELQKDNITYVFNIRTKDGRIIPIAWEAKRMQNGWLKIKGSLEGAEIKGALRKDYHFNCLNLMALEEDFSKLVRKTRETDINEEIITSLVFGDMDGFGEFNKIYGHKIGDIVLEELITSLKDEFKRVGDGIYRKGGDEFIVLCNETNKYKTGEKINKIRDLLNRTNIVVQFNKGKITVSKKIQETHEIAKNLFENEITQESNKITLRRLGLLGKYIKTESILDNPNFNHLVGEIILPPIGSTWGVVELKKSEIIDMDLTNDEKNKLLEGLIRRADICTLNGKGGGKNIVIIENEGGQFEIK